MSVNRVLCKNACAKRSHALRKKKAAVNVSGSVGFRMNFVVSLYVRKWRNKRTSSEMDITPNGGNVLRASLPFFLEIRNDLHKHITIT